MIYPCGELVCANRIHEMNYLMDDEKKKKGIKKGESIYKAVANNDAYMVSGCK